MRCCFVQFSAAFRKRVIYGCGAAGADTSLSIRMRACMSLYRPSVLAERERGSMNEQPRGAFRKVQQQFLDFSEIFCARARVCVCVCVCVCMRWREEAGFAEGSLYRGVIVRCLEKWILSEVQVYGCVRK